MNNDLPTRYCISRYLDESVCLSIDGKVVVTITLKEVRNTRVELVIEAPLRVKILPGERVNESY